MRKYNIDIILIFADAIDGLAGDEQELADLVSRLDNTSASYGMEISAEKTKLMTNNINGINKKITVNGQRLETVSKFKYLGSVIADEGAKPEIISRIAQTTAERQRKRWEDNIKKWTGLDFSETQRAADDRKKWRQLVSRSSVVPNNTTGYGIDDDDDDIADVSFLLFGNYKDHLYQARSGGVSYKKLNSKGSVKVG